MPHVYKDIPARIAATGSYLPERVVANHELAGLESTNGAVERLLGAVERRAAGEDETCSDMITAAARDVLERAEIGPEQLDRIFVSTTPGDYFEPSTASVVQHKLGASCPAMDITMSCVGWVAGLDYALRCIATGENRILVMAGTIVSKGTAFHNPMHRAIFGDGAGGILLERTEKPGQFMAGALWTDGQFHDIITMPHNISVATPRIPSEYHGSFYMGERQLINQALRNNLPLGVENVLSMAGVTRDDLDLCFIHQPSRPLFEVAVEAVGVDREKLVEDYAHYGNTISAELPISLDESVRNGRVKRGDLIMKVTYGAGFSGGILVYRY
ncbi:MAG: 3-oxoacyl-ACP synthase III family protein [Candidatus Hydrogenedentota bacterium]